MVRKIETYSTVLINLYYSTVTEIDKSKFATRDVFGNRQILGLKLRWSLTLKIIRILLVNNLSFCINSYCLCRDVLSLVVTHGHRGA